MTRSRTSDPAATLSRDLRSFRPVWLGHGEPPEIARPLRRGFAIDVAIIGGGVSGALMADAALQAGLSVAVFDRRGLVRGSTAASTALLQFELDQPLTLLAEKIGMARAARAWWRSAGALEHLRGRIDDLGLRCGFRERDTAYLPGNILGVAGLKQEAAERQKLGLRSRYIDADALRARTGIERRGAIWSAGAAEVDPVRLVRGLWRHAAASGARLHAPVDIVDIDPGRGGVTLTTDAGIGIAAKHVALATGYELARMLHPRGYRVISTWAMATAPQPDALWPSRCLIWEAADPYLYLRTTADDRILIGGEDEDFADGERRDRISPGKFATLRRKLGKLMPGVATEADFAWTGAFGLSTTSLPAIGPVPGAKGCFAAMGYGGNGITFSAIAAEMFRRHLLGIPDPDADIFGLG